MDFVDTLLLMVDCLGDDEEEAGPPVTPPVAIVAQSVVTQPNLFHDIPVMVLLHTGAFVAIAETRHRKSRMFAARKLTVMQRKQDARKFLSMKTT